MSLILTLALSCAEVQLKSTANHKMDVTPEGIFERFMKRQGGSYCFGQNGLLLQMLRGLGFRYIYPRILLAERDLHFTI